MAKLTKVIITKTIVRPYQNHAEPTIGTNGYIVTEKNTPENQTCIRFLATKLGYEYNKGDDPDYKYIRLFIPNDNFSVYEKSSEKKLKQIKNKM